MHLYINNVCCHVFIADCLVSCSRGLLTFDAYEKFHEVEDWNLIILIACEIDNLLDWVSASEASC